MNNPAPLVSDHLSQRLTDAAVSMAQALSAIDNDVVRDDVSQAVENFLTTAVVDTFDYAQDLAYDGLGAHTRADDDVRVMPLGTDGDTSTFYVVGGMYDSASDDDYGDDDEYDYDDDFYSDDDVDNFVNLSVDYIKDNYPFIYRLLQAYVAKEREQADSHRNQDFQLADEHGDFVKAYLDLLWDLDKEQIEEVYEEARDYTSRFDSDEPQPMPTRKFVAAAANAQRKQGGKCAKRCRKGQCSGWGVNTSARNEGVCGRVSFSNAACNYDQAQRRAPKHTGNPATTASLILRAIRL